MYKSFLKIKMTKTGKGVYTLVDIPAKAPIMEITGDIRTQESMYKPQDSAWLQISPKYYIGPSGAVDDQIRHSCDPNCYIKAVGSRAFLYSLYQIKANTELTFDYSTTSTDTTDTWKLECKCGSYKCRKIISGMQYLSKELFEEYKSKGMIPLLFIDSRFNDD